MFVIYSPNGINVCGTSVRSLRAESRPKTYPCDVASVQGYSSLKTNSFLPFWRKRPPKGKFQNSVSMIFVTCSCQEWWKSVKESDQNDAWYTWQKRKKTVF